MKILHSFTGSPDGEDAGSTGMVDDGKGNLFGLTEGGGTGSCGTVYEIERVARGVHESVLWSFQGAAAGDGCSPVGAPVFDSAGNLYGVTLGGGTHAGGTVFELSRAGKGVWTEKVLWSFTSSGNGGPDGNLPLAGPTLDQEGNIYGTTEEGGGSSTAEGYGVVYKLSPNKDGTWSETILHAFTGDTDGAQPFASVTLDKAGNIYGTTNIGGGVTSTNCYFGCGTVFELKKSSGWAETLIHIFDGNGSSPFAPVIFTKEGHLLGTAAFNPDGSQGLVYELVRTSSGPWRYTVIHQFTGVFGDGEMPMSGLVARGNRYYGVTEGSSTSQYCCGTIYGLTHNASGWSEAVLHVFQGGADGGGLTAGTNLVIGPTGKLFGSTIGGGASNLGVVFAFTPPPWSEFNNPAPAKPDPDDK